PEARSSYRWRRQGAAHANQNTSTRTAHAFRQDAKKLILVLSAYDTTVKYQTPFVAIEGTQGKPRFLAVASARVLASRAVLTGAWSHGCDPLRRHATDPEWRRSSGSATCARRSSRATAKCARSMASASTSTTARRSVWSASPAAARA